MRLTFCSEIGTFRRKCAKRLRSFQCGSWRMCDKRRCRVVNLPMEVFHGARGAIAGSFCVIKSCYWGNAMLRSFRKEVKMGGEPHFAQSRAGPSATAHTPKMYTESLQKKSGAQVEARNCRFVPATVIIINPVHNERNRLESTSAQTWRASITI